MEKIKDQLRKKEDEVYELNIQVAQMKLENKKLLREVAVLKTSHPEEGQETSHSSPESSGVGVGNKFRIINQKDVLHLSAIKGKSGTSDTSFSMYYQEDIAKSFNKLPGICPNILAVAAIEIADNTLSTVSFRNDITDEPELSWKKIPKCLFRRFPPTAVLFDENANLMHYGEDALFYADSFKPHGYLYKHLIDLLQRDQIKRDSTAVDAQGKDLSCMKVFEKVLSHLVDEMWTRMFEKIGDMIRDTEIVWGFPVPSCCSYASKRLMREAMQKSGLKPQQIHIISYHEAILEYIDHIPAEAFEDVHRETLQKALTEDECVMVDIQDRTYSVTYIRKRDMRVLHKVKGHETGVHEAFNKFVIKIIGASVFSKFCDSEARDHRELISTIIAKAMDIPAEQTGTINIKIPAAFMEFYSEETGETIQEAIDQSPLKGKVKHIGGDRLKINFPIFKDFFKDSINKVSESIREILNKQFGRGDSKGIPFVLTGSLANIPMIRSGITVMFPNNTMIVPPFPEKAVIKGTHFLLHTTRQTVVAKYTYAFLLQFSSASGKGKDDIEVFEILIQSGQYATRFEPFSKTVAYTVPEYGSLHIQTCVSSEIKPMLVQKDFLPIASVVVDKSKSKKEEDVMVECSMWFDIARLVVRITDMSSKPYQCYYTYIDI